MIKSTRFSGVVLFCALFAFLFNSRTYASSHREPPLIANDPLADNTDLYAFRSPDDPNTITIIANYIPGELPYGGPNYYSFGENVRYEIHIDNDASFPGDEIVYRFVFSQENQDPSTFFNIRLGILVNKLRMHSPLWIKINGSVRLNRILAGTSYIPLGEIHPWYLISQALKPGLKMISVPKRSAKTKKKPCRSFAVNTALPFLRTR